LTTATANDMALSIVMENADGNSIPTLSLGSSQGFTSEFSNGVQVNGNSSAGALANKTVTVPGAVTFPTWSTNHSVSGSNGSIWLGISVALKP
jgi:hypothetical protein